MPFTTAFWNKWINRAPPAGYGIPLGYRVMDGEIQKTRFVLPHIRRMEHMVVLGKTGTGKTSLIKTMLAHDVRHGHGFLCVDLHGDLSPFVLGCIRDREERSKEDLSQRTVIISPADPYSSVGMNILRTKRALPPLVSEIVAVFLRRWQLDSFGARTEELLRNSLWVLAENGLTLLELSLFLTDLGFRAALIERCQNAEVRAYFRTRYEQMSEAMQTVVREAILNKASAFSTDPAIRHIIGQQVGFDIAEAIDAGCWVILRLEKSRLGEDSDVLASLILARFKDAIFGRRKRTLFTFYADEVQNLVSSGDTFEHLLSEARKFGIGVVTANQHLGQYSPQIRSTLLSAGTTLFFRPSSEDAPYIARSLDGGSAVERLLKELPNRHFLLRSGGERWREIVAGSAADSECATTDLVERSNTRWAKPRALIETEIASRQRLAGKESLEAWA